MTHNCTPHQPELSKSNGDESTGIDGRPRLHQCAGSVHVHDAGACRSLATTAVLPEHRDPAGSENPPSESDAPSKCPSLSCRINRSPSRLPSFVVFPFGEHDMYALPPPQSEKFRLGRMFDLLSRRTLQNLALPRPTPRAQFSYGLVRQIHRSSCGEGW